MEILNETKKKLIVRDVNAQISIRSRYLRYMASHRTTWLLEAYFQDFKL